MSDQCAATGFTECPQKTGQPQRTQRGTKSRHLQATIGCCKLTLGLHAGHQKVNNCSTCSYSDYKFSLNKELPKEFFGLNVSLAYSDTNANSVDDRGQVPR